MTFDVPFTAILSFWKSLSFTMCFLGELQTRSQCLVGRQAGHASASFATGHQLPGQDLNLHEVLVVRITLLKFNLRLSLFQFVLRPLFDVA